MTAPAIPHPQRDLALFLCASCEWQGEREDKPTFCPQCGSVYVDEYEEVFEGDAVDGEPDEAVLDEIAAERRRQVEVEGFTPEHDDTHRHGEMALAAAAYAGETAVHGTGLRWKIKALYWPWAPQWWKPKSRRRDLVRAAALLVAEIERLDRESSAI